MISSLAGEIISKGRNWVEIEVAGVGYRVAVGERLLREWGEGDEVRARTYMAVSDKDISLYGFKTNDEVVLFRMMIGVSGVGPKTAAMILGGNEADEIIKAVSRADVAFFQKVKGVGKKAAQKIIIDLKSKIGGLKDLDLAGGGGQEKDDLYYSLKNLGFSVREMEKVIGKVPVDLKTVEDKLGWCLRNLGEI